MHAAHVATRRAALHGIQTAARDAAFTFDHRAAPKSAAAVDKVTVTDTPASTTVAASGSASDSSDDNAQLTLASETLGKANEALLVKAGMTVGEAASKERSRPRPVRATVGKAACRPTRNPS